MKHVNIDAMAECAFESGLLGEAGGYHHQPSVVLSS